MIHPAPGARRVRAAGPARARRSVLKLEEAEGRLAPAGVLLYTDVDGDDVRIATTRGTANDLAGAVVLGPLTGLGQQLLRLDLTTNPRFAGTDLAITARPAGGAGDGSANVGHINAAGMDLGTVLVDGDLGAIDAGDGVTATSACRGLAVQSLGRFGTSTGAPDLASDFDGRLDRLTVRSDVFEAAVNVTDSAGANGRIGSVLVGGSVVGGP